MGRTLNRYGGTEDYTEDGQIGEAYDAEASFEPEEAVTVEADEGAALELEHPWAFNSGYYLVYLIVFAISFAVLRNLFGRVYKQVGDKPVDVKGRFRRMFAKKDRDEKTVTEEVTNDIKEKMISDSNDASENKIEINASYDYQVLPDENECYTK